MLSDREESPDCARTVIPEHQGKILEREPEMPLGHIDAPPQINSSVDRIIVRLSFPFRNFKEIIELHCSSSVSDERPSLWIRYWTVKIAVWVSLFVHLFKKLVGAHCRNLVRQQFNPRLNAVVLSRGAVRVTDNQ